MHFPSNIAIDSKVVAKSGIHTLKVVKYYTEHKNETFIDIVQGGNKEDILTFLKTHNLDKGEKQFSWYHIYWMLKDKDFFFKVLEVLR